MIPNAVQQGAWCDTCKRKSREKFVRRCFESIFEKTFEPARPEWLRSESGFKIELDGYNPALGVAFEHHGIQHYQWTRFFQKFC